MLRRFCVKNKETREGLWIFQTFDPVLIFFLSWFIENIKHNRVAQFQKSLIKKSGTKLLYEFTSLLLSLCTIAIKCYRRSLYSLVMN